MIIGECFVTIIIEVVIIGRWSKTIMIENMIIEDVIIENNIMEGDPIQWQLLKTRLVKIIGELFLIKIIGSIGLRMHFLYIPALLSKEIQSNMVLRIPTGRAI